MPSIASSISNSILSNSFAESEFASSIFYTDVDSRNGTVGAFKNLPITEAQRVNSRLQYEIIFIKTNCRQQMISLGSFVNNNWTN